MKIVLHNPHTNFHFGNTVQNYIFRIKSFKKYKYFIDFLRKEDKKYQIFVDGKSSFPTYISKIIPVKLEVFLWAIINGINPMQLSIISNLDDIEDDSIFLSFALEGLGGKDETLLKLRKKKFLKIFHLTHYVQNSSKVAENFKFCKGDFLIAENNLFKNSEYFRKLFLFYKKDVYFLPFVFQKKFVKYKDFTKRINKCLATGTIIKIREFEINSKIFQDFYNFFKILTLHPMRVEIYNKKNTMKTLIDSYIANFWENKRMSWEKVNSPIIRWYMRFYNAIFATKREYLNFDIVEKYNNYKMFISPEEINDLPGIGFVEGMASGSAYIGKIDPMYTDLGLIPGKHYIGYNGNLEDLKNKIFYYQKNQNKLERIAQEGYEFVTKNLNGEVVACTFWADLDKLGKNFKKQGRRGLKFKSSMTIN